MQKINLCMLSMLVAFSVASYASDVEKKVEITSVEIVEVTETVVPAPVVKQGVAVLTVPDAAELAIKAEALKRDQERAQAEAQAAQELRLAAQAEEQNRTKAAKEAADRLNAARLAVQTE